MRALPPRMLINALGCGEGAAGGAFCMPVGGLGCLGAWVLACAGGGAGGEGLGPGAVVLVLDGALVEGQANGVNAIAKISGRIETFARKHVP